MYIIIQVNYKQIGQNYNQQMENMQAQSFMNSNNGPVINSNNGPIIQLKKQNSQRSLYSNNQAQSPLHLQVKNSSIIKPKDKKNNKSNNHLLATSKNHDQQLRHLAIKKPKNTNIRYNSQQQNKLNNSKNPKQRQFAKQGGTKSHNINIASQNVGSFKHEYRNYKNLQNATISHLNQSYLNQIQHNQSPRQLLKFHQKAPVKNIHSLSTTIDFLKQQIISATSQSNKYTPANFNTSFKSNNMGKVNSQDMQNRTLRSSQGGRWLRSQSYMQNNLNQNKQNLNLQFPFSLIKNYHKHQSKFYYDLQNYMKTLYQFQESMRMKSLPISLMNSLQDIKIKMQMYMQKLVKLQNLPIDKPTQQWSQGQLTKFFTNYQSIFLNQKSVDSTHQSLTLKKYKNCVYFGHISSQGKKEGQGVIYYYSGKIFEGKFVNDQKVYGFQMDQNGDQIYVGQFLKGIKHGYGILKDNQNLLWGKFTNGYFSNTNSQKIDQNQNPKVQNSKLGITSQSFMKNRVRIQNQNQNHKNKKQGFKITFNYFIAYYQELIIFKNQTSQIYVGNFDQINIQKNGQGLEIFSNGDVYLGNYQHNAPQQYGQYYWSSGAYYRGQFMSGMRHGKGKWHMLHGDMYQGDYMNDKKNGKGIYLWKNGSKYVGSFQNDYRHGYGQMTWNDGRSYKGQWLNGIQKNVKIKLDKGIDKQLSSPGTSGLINIKQKSNQPKKPFLPGVTKKTFRSISNPNTKQSFHTVDSHFPIKKKIAIQNIKALYNPSNY